MLVRAASTVAIALFTLTAGAGCLVEDSGPLDVGGDGGSGGAGQGATTGAASTTSASSGGSSFHCDPAAAPGSIHALEADSFSIEQIEPVSMCKYRGDVMLIVNTAAFCGYTPQYGPLEALQKKYGPQGLHVLGFISNDFNQAGNPDDVEACTEQYSVTFEQFNYVHVKSGPEQHAIFKWLASQPQPDASVPPDATWNFNKWLISRDGELIAHWTQSVYPGDNPSDPNDVDVVSPAIEAELAKP